MKKRLSTLMVLLCITMIGSMLTAFAGADPIKVEKPNGLVAKRASSKAIKLTWKSVTDANGYVVYKYSAKSKQYKAAKHITKGTTATWTQKKLKSNTNHKYRIKAYKKDGKSKVFSSYSNYVKVRTWAKGLKYTNIKRVYPLDDDKFKISFKCLYQARILRIPEVRGKTIIDKKTSWSSSDQTIAKVSSKGLVRAQGKAGSCNITAKVHTGQTATFKITVADYTHPATFSNLDKIHKNAAFILQNDKDDIGDIAAKLGSMKTGDIERDSKGKVRFYVPGGSLGAEVDQKVRNLFANTSIDWISADEGSVQFDVKAGKQNVGFEYRNIDRSLGWIKLAPCWYYIESDGKDII